MFIVSKFAISLISPLGSSLFGGIIAVLLGLFGRSRLALYFGILAVVWLGVWSLPVASDWLRAQLEQQFPAVPVEALPPAEVAVVLGGGIYPREYRQRWPNLKSTADRVWHAARIYHAGKARVLLLSGGHNPRISATSEAVAMRSFLQDMGVPYEAIWLEQRSRSTTQNAEFSARWLQARSLDRVILVTSALHMPRSVALFEAQGLSVIPAATDHQVQERPLWQYWLPAASALDGSARAIKELVGRFVGR